MVVRLGQMDIIKPVWNVDFTPSRYASEVDNYMDALQLMGVDNYIYSESDVDVYEKFENKKNFIYVNNLDGKKQTQSKDSGLNFSILLSKFLNNKNF